MSGDYGEALVRDRLGRLEGRCRIDPVMRSEAAPFLAAGFDLVGVAVRSEAAGRWCEITPAEVTFGSLAHPERKRVPL